MLRCICSFNLSISKMKGSESDDRWLGFDERWEPCPRPWRFYTLLLTLNEPSIACHPGPTTMRPVRVEQRFSSQPNKELMLSGWPKATLRLIFATSRAGARRAREAANMGRSEIILFHMHQDLSTLFSANRILTYYVPSSLVL